MPTVDRKGIGGGIVPPFPSQVEKIVVISHREFFFKAKDYGIDIDKNNKTEGIKRGCAKRREREKPGRHTRNAMASIGQGREIGGGEDGYTRGNLRRGGDYEPEIRHLSATACGGERV